MTASDTREDILVLKFGSSVLRSAADLPLAVQEIYRHLRHGRRVLAVVSAYAGVTDSLFAQAFATGCDRVATAELVAGGERASATDLYRELTRSGIPAAVSDPRDFALRAVGRTLDAELDSVDTAALEACLHRAPVAVLPGYFGVDAQGRTSLLGRGGSDLSALWLASALGANAILIKDVDGLYERDPALPGPRPRRLVTASWDTALAAAGRLVQPKAIRFARSRGLEFGVGGALTREPTRVGSGPDRHEARAARGMPLRLALLGLGTVGTGVYERLRTLPERFTVTRVLVRHADRSREAQVSAAQLVTHPAAALEDDPDLVIEVLGGLAPAAEIVDRALARGIPVVTANKSLVAQHWRGLLRHATGNAPRLRFSAAVGGAVPMLEQLAAQAQHGTITGLRGVINGTCNYVLDRIAAGTELREAVREAQAQGFAEADPSSDLSGLDAAFKLSLLARAGLRRDVDPLSIERQGIDGLEPQWIRNARENGRTVRLVAELALGAGDIAATIAPRALDPSDFLAGARGEENRLEIRLADGRCVQINGKGAGRWPTATAVLADVFDVAEQRLAVGGWSRSATAPLDGQRTTRNGQRLGVSSG